MSKKNAPASWCFKPINEHYIRNDIILGKCFECDAELSFDQLKQKQERIVFTARDHDLSSFN